MNLTFGTMPTAFGRTMPILLGRELPEHAFVGVHVDGGTYYEPATGAEVRLDGPVVAVHAGVRITTPLHAVVLCWDRVERTVPFNRVVPRLALPQHQSNDELVERLRELDIKHSRYAEVGLTTDARQMEFCRERVAHELSVRGLGDVVDATDDLKYARDNQFHADGRRDYGHQRMIDAARSCIGRVLDEVPHLARPVAGPDEPVRLATVHKGIDRPRALVRILRMTNGRDKRVVVEYRENRRADESGDGFRAGQLDTVAPTRLILTAPPAVGA